MKSFFIFTRSVVDQASVSPLKLEEIKKKVVFSFFKPVLRRSVFLKEVLKTLNI